MHERMLDKTAQPSEAEMFNWIGLPIAAEWSALRKFLEETYEITPRFNSGGQRYGWNLQYRLGERPLCELYPEHGSFTALIILGKVNLGQALERIESFGPLVRQALTDTPRYHDGCWMYLRIADRLTCRQEVQEVEQLLLIKRKPTRKKTPAA